jgi:hypothetical protein
MNSPLNSVDRLAPYAGTGKVAPSSHTEKDKHRRNSEELEQSFEEELEQEKKKEHRHDAVVLHEEKEPNDQPVDEQGEDSATEVKRPPNPDDDTLPEPGHIDVKA